VVIPVTAIIMGLCWSTMVFAPLKLIAVFLHEFSHALATWLTCGKVSGIEINENFGGVCYSRGGNRPIILSAGYIGSCVWGVFFILMCCSKIPTRVAACFFMAACIATVLILRIKERRCFGCRCAFGLVVRIVILLIAGLVAGMWVLETFVEMSVHPLTWTVLIIGTVCTMTAVYDTLHDVLFKKIDNKQQGQSDAVMFADEFFGSARCWGLIWSLIALTCVGASFFGYIALSSSCP